MLHRLCGPLSIHLSFNLATVLPGGQLIALAAPLKYLVISNGCSHRLRRGLPGYLILFAPHAVVPSASVLIQSAAFATDVPSDLYAFHRYTGIPPPLSYSSLSVHNAFPG